jgi:hypothetical protein
MHFLYLTPCLPSPFRVGAFVGYKSQGTNAILCVARMCGSEIWVVPGSTAPSDRGVQRLRRRTAVHGERVWFGGGGIVGMELLRGEWRRLNTENPDDAEQGAALWVRGEMSWELSVVVTSTAAHCDCRTRVRRACNRTVHSDVPDDDTERMRVELEGIGIGFEDFEQQADRFQRLAAGPSVNLVGFSDGSLSRGDGNNGG